MKELSIEEKTYDGNYKAYIELINRLENVKDAIKKQNYGIAMDVLCKPYTAFQVTTHSELKESVDERIRKALIYRYQGDGCICNNEYRIDYKDIRAWLEKQGEQKQELLTKEKALKNSPFVEQKPADLPKGEDYGIDGLYAAIDILQKTLGEVDGYQSDDGILEHKCAISAVKELSKQQNNTWSEEDERTYKSVLYAFEHNYPLNSEQQKFVKSFKNRYFWKPSKGQLECLGYAIEKAEKDWSPLTNNRIYLTLKALKEQLLELRGSKV